MGSAGTQPSVTKNQSSPSHSSSYHSTPRSRNSPPLFDSWNNDASVSSRESSSMMDSRSSRHKEAATRGGSRGVRSSVMDRDPQPPPPPPPGPPPPKTAVKSKNASSAGNVNHDRQRPSKDRSNNVVTDHRDDRDRDASFVLDHPYKNEEDEDEDYEEDHHDDVARSKNRSNDSKQRQRQRHHAQDENYHHHHHHDPEEEEEEQSIETHILQYGHDGTPSVHSQSTRESAADRRRKRAMEQKQQHEKQLGGHVHEDGVRDSRRRTGGVGGATTASSNPRNASTGTDATRHKSSQNSKSKQNPMSPKSARTEHVDGNSSYYDDPPLQFYSEDSDGGDSEEEDYDSENDDNHSEHDAAPNQAIALNQNQSSSDNHNGTKKKKGGFSRVKNLIRMGNGKHKSSTSPKKKVKSDSLDRKSSGASAQDANNSPKKRGGFLQRLSLSPGKRRSLTPENKNRGRAKESAKNGSSNRKGGMSMSPFRFRSRSRSRSKAGTEDEKKSNETPVKRSAEIVVNQEKLRENEKRMQEMADMDELVRRTSVKSHTENGIPTSSKARSEKKRNDAASTSTFERLRKDREAKRKQDLMANNGGFPVFSQDENDDLGEEQKSRVSVSTKSRGSSRWVEASQDYEDHDPDVEPRSSKVSVSAKSHTSNSVSHTSTHSENRHVSKFEHVRRNREHKFDPKKNSFLQDSDVEILSASHSDDVSEVTDPTYMTKEMREQKVRSPIHDLDTVHETSSQENSPKTKSHTETTEFYHRHQPQSSSPPLYAKDVSEKETSPAYSLKELNEQKSKSFEGSSGSSIHKIPAKSKSQDIESIKSKSKDDSGFVDHGDPNDKWPDTVADGWNPDNFTGKENFVSTIDPFMKATPSTDPFDRPFYPMDSKDDEPKQMFSFVYSESDAELERGGVSKDTMTGLSFDSEDDDMNNMDGLSYATPASKSDVTEVIKNSAGANRMRSKKQMLPPSASFVPKTTGRVERSTLASSDADGFLGIDERSGAVTLNVEHDSEKKWENAHSTKTQTGRLSQKALHRPKKNSDTVLHYEKPQEIPLMQTNNQHARDSHQSRSPERSLHQAPSYISERREKRKAREKELKEKEIEKKIIEPNPYLLHRGKNDVSVANERGRRREWIFASKGKNKLSAHSLRTYSPDKLKFALSNENDSVQTKTLAHSAPRSPRHTESRRDKRFNREDSWFEKPRYDTRPYRAAFASSSSSSRSTFKAPAVFGKNPIEGPFKAPEPYSRRTDPVLASVAHIKDPIQRAGAVILSAAAIPIQAEMRRYLAVKHREDRAWGIVVIQAYFRRWKAELTRYKYLYCATRIQAAFRGWLLRDTMEDKHYCATQIQKIARGYLATLRVYEDLYNITVVQSIARRNAAINEARRLRTARVNRSATKIQSAWRRYYVQLNYQFDIVDIIIVQSIVRRKAAIAKAKRMREQRIYDAATTIQKNWRSYDCTMNYLHTVADVLVVQSVVRRWIASRYVSDYRDKLYFKMALRIQLLIRSWLARTKVKKQRAARDIQKAWRGFWTYTDYVFTLADIIIVQKTVRAHQARKRVAVMFKERKEKTENDAATVIQKSWRRYSAQMEMLFNLVHIIIAQSVIRRRIAIIKFKPRLLEYRAATKIQRAWRTFIRKRDFMENYCATIIQSLIRRQLSIQLKYQMIAARTIQAWYRCQATRRGYLYYTSARKIQTIWRGYDARKLADEERWVREYAATTIQKTWRMFYQFSSYTIYKHEQKAATDIQRHWRGFWKYSHFIIMRYEVCKIQALVRGVQQRKRLANQVEAAIVIQTAARCLIAKKTCHMERLFLAMIYAAQKGLSQKIAARTIQRGFKEYNLRKKQKHAALVIERFFIWVRAEVEREIERRELQKIKRREHSRRESVNKDILEDAYRSVSDNKKNESALQTKLKKSLNATSRSRPNSSQRPGQLLSVEMKDTVSAVSGLTNPVESSMKFKIKNKGYHDRIDDELEGAWQETIKKRVSDSFDGRPNTSESHKENSSTFTPTFKVSARSLSRNREELRRARVP